MMPFPIPVEVLYAGLGGTLLALLVATATNGWHPRVFFLLALRLAIGWHFLFEGIHKIQSIEMGETDTNQPFSSEKYFASSTGPVGNYIRSEYLDTNEKFIQNFIVPKDVSGTEPAEPSTDAQHLARLPEGAVNLFDNISSKIESLESPAKKVELQKKLKAVQRDYALWITDASIKDSQDKYISGDLSLTLSTRLKMLESRRNELANFAAARSADLGRKKFFSQLQTLRADVEDAEKKLIADAKSFTSDLVSEVEKALAAQETKDNSETTLSSIQTLDNQTKWGITIIGACLLAGFLTRLAALGGAIFLTMTYLTQLPFPWFPIPPNTEGNPVFINKNVIEALGLLVIMVHPTGRWLGLDALLDYVLHRKKPIAS